MNDDDDDEDEDLKIQKEMELEWERQETEKSNKGIIKILETIKSKQRSPQKHDKKHPSNPKINPFIFDGHLKITFPSNIGNKQKKKLHFHPKNTLNKRKKMKFELKRQVSKKRKYEMKKYKKEFGRTDDDKYFDDNDDGNDDKKDDNYDDNDNDEELENNNDDDNDNDNDIMIVENENENETESEDDELFAEEELARKQLMAKPKQISSELRDILDIAADEEDENGEIIRNDKDKDIEDDKCGIIKGLLAEKSDIKLINKHKEIYDMKRNEIHQKLLNNEDDKQFELIKRAFIDGEYRKLQKKNSSKLFNGNNINNDGEYELNFKSRNYEIDYKNQPEYYLSDDEDKNEFCCYDENGQFYDIYTIRMKIMEWNKINNINNNDYSNEYNEDEDDEEDKHSKLLRQKRVEKKEIITNNTNNLNNNNNDKINKNDKNAMRILDKLRNKKLRKNKSQTSPSSTLSNKPALTKSHSIDTNFENFYFEKGLEIPMLRRSNSSSFLLHRDKCIEINNSNTNHNNLQNSNKVIGNNSKAVVFQKSRKRKNYDDDDNSLRKRRRF